MTALVNWHGLQADPDNLPLPRSGVYRTERIASGRSYVWASQNVKARVRSHDAGSTAAVADRVAGQQGEKPCRINLRAHSPATLRKHCDPGVVNSARKRLFDACRTQPRGKEVASVTGGAEFTDHLRNRLLQNAFSG